MRTIARRPVGVWLFAICNIVWSVWGIVSVSAGFERPLPHGYSRAAAAFAPYATAVWIGTLVSAALAWYGSQVGRTALLVLLGIAAALHVQEDYLGFFHMLEVAERHPYLWRSPLFWFDLTLGDSFGRAGGC